MGWLDGDIAELVADGLSSADLPLPITLTRTVTGAADPDKPWIPPTNATEQFACTGWVEGYSDFAIANGVVQASDRKVMILVTTLATVPAPGDMVQVKGQTFTVQSVKTDPATAVWECQSRA